MARREQTNTLNPLLQSSLKPNCEVGESKSSVSRLSRKEMLDKWLEDKKKGADAKKATQEPVRFQDMLRNDKINFYNVKNTPGVGSLQNIGLDTAKRSANKENAGNPGSTTPIRTLSANKKPSLFGSALNAQKTKSIYGDVSNAKTPRPKDQSLGARVDANNGSRSPFSQMRSHNLASRSPISKDPGHKNPTGDTRQSTLGPVSASSISGFRTQNASTHKSFGGQVMNRLELARQAKKGNPTTQAGESNLGETIVKSAIAQQQTVTETHVIENRKPENLFQEETQNSSNIVENPENPSHNANEHFEEAQATDNFRGEEKELSNKNENAQNFSDFAFDVTPVKQNGQNHQIRPLEDTSVLFGELYQNYKAGCSDWKQQFEKFILNKERKLTHFCILEGKFKPSDEIGEQYSRDSKFWVLFLQYIRDRAANEQEYRLYEIVLSQATPSNVLQRDLERIVDTDTSNQREQSNYALTTPVRSHGPSHYEHISVSPLENHNYFADRNPANNNPESIHDEGRYFGAAKTLVDFKITGVREQPRYNPQEERNAGIKRARSEMESQKMEEEGDGEDMLMHQTKKPKESQRNGHRNESRTHLLDFLDHDKDLDQFGSTVSYAVLNATKTQQKKYGTEKILTPVRLSRRLQAKTKNENNGNIVEMLGDISDFSEFPSLQEKNFVFVKNPSLADAWAQERKLKNKTNPN